MSAQKPIPAAQYREMAKPARRSKYGNRRVTVDGRTYDSKAEAAYCETLLLREKAGEVSGVQLQRPFPLIINGVNCGSYFADAAFWDHREDRFRAIDVKGKDTAVSRLKRKIVAAIYQVEVEIVKA